MKLNVSPMTHFIYDFLTTDTFEKIKEVSDTPSLFQADTPGGYQRNQ